MMKTAWIESMSTFVEDWNTHNQNGMRVVVRPLQLLGHIVGDYTYLYQRTKYDAENQVNRLFHLNSLIPAVLVIPLQPKKWWVVLRFHWKAAVFFSERPIVYSIWSGYSKDQHVLSFTEESSHLKVKEVDASDVNFITDYSCDGILGLYKLSGCENVRIL